ncbi:MAG: ThiF family adenylyltransferase, partial [Proteobacteria bacterium]|nr:ThiF family adenylyltransferase [Pseudomonadota bacterium]
MNVAGCFLFRGEAVNKEIRVLSGGERARLCLAGLFLHGHNVLILDEPANHLDVETAGELAEALARCGVGKLTLIDLDHIAVSNTNRQIHALGDAYGMAKVDAMAERVLQINPRAEISRIDDFVTVENVEALLGHPFDYVIDAIDAVKVKTAI